MALLNASVAVDVGISNVDPIIWNEHKVDTLPIVAARVLERINPGACVLA